MGKIVFWSMCKNMFEEFVAMQVSFTLCFGVNAKKVCLFIYLLIAHMYFYMNGGA